MWKSSVDSRKIITVNKKDHQKHAFYLKHLKDFLHLNIINTINFIRFITNADNMIFYSKKADVEALTDKLVFCFMRIGNEIYMVVFVIRSPVHIRDFQIF